MPRELRKSIIDSLWHSYCSSTAQMQLINTHLKRMGAESIILDHFAIIDLPGPHSGIPSLKELFGMIGYGERGKDYLSDKQNDFVWMAETDHQHQPAKNVLPQVVVADFRLDELPVEIRAIITKYAHMASKPPIDEIKKLIAAHAFNPAAQIITTYLSGRDWPLPTVKEFNTVHEFNELLAWVLVFGRCPNHFTISVHHLTAFDSMATFLSFIEDNLGLTLNKEGGRIKGGKESGIEQGSTIGMLQSVTLSDGHIELPTGFVEFVWRHPHDISCTKPMLWSDYFTGFIPQYANRVIESLYCEK
jgi:hypothetical protein